MEAKDESQRVSRSMTARRPRLLVLGIGNLLMSDDGVGVHAIRKLRKQKRAGVLVTEIGTGVLDAVPLLAWSDRVLVIDALQAGAAPGTLYFAHLSQTQRNGPLSLHEFDLASALALMDRSSRQPDVYVLGVEPASLDLGLELTDAVRAAMPSIISTVNETLASWKMAPTRHDYCS
jgi:hydrogenase maturation protease